jgi:NRPS condensation-like uncharacterized protein
VTRVPASPLVPAVEGISAIADNVLVVVVQLPGVLDVELLHRAIRAVSVNLPELGGRPRQTFWRTCWVLDEEPGWTVVEFPDADDDLAAEVERELFAAPFHLQGELPLEVRLVHLSGGDRLFVRVHHLLADGGGAKELVYRIAVAYRALAAEPDWTPPPVRRRHALWRLAAAWRPWHVPAYLLGLLDDLWSLRPGRGMTVPMDPGATEAVRCGRLHVGPPRVRAFKERWGRRGATVNDLLVTAFARALEVSWPDAPQPEINLVCTADLRQVVPGAAEVENLSSIHTLRMGRRPLPAARELMERTLASTRRWKRGFVGYGFALVAITLAAVLPGGILRSLVARAVQQGPPQRLGPVVFTNMGRLDPARLDFGAGPCQHAYILPPIGHPPVLIAAATGCGDAVDVTVAHHDPAIGVERVQTFLDAVDAEIDALIDRR